MLNQAPPTSHPMGLRIVLGAETASQLATVWEELGGETLGNMFCLSRAQTCTPRTRQWGIPSHTHSLPQRRAPQGDGKACLFCYRVALRKFSQFLKASKFSLHKGSSDIAHRATIRLR